jgi:hypothetical protein
MANPPVTVTDNQLRMRRFVANVRLFMRDYQELNRLIKGNETNPRMMMFALVDTLTDFNTTPPLIGEFSLDQIPASILLRGVVKHVLESVSLLQMRNHLDVSDGGVQVGISNKSPLMMNFLQYFLNHYEQQKLKWKVAKNIEMAFGYGVSSEYDNLGGWYGDFTSVAELN